MSEETAGEETKQEKIKRELNEQLPPDKLSKLRIDVRLLRGGLTQVLVRRIIDTELDGGGGS